MADDITKSKSIDFIDNAKKKKSKMTKEVTFYFLCVLNIEELT